MEMSSKQKKVKTTLKNIKKAPSDDIRELFRVSDISKENFVQGIIEFPIIEQEQLIDAMLQDILLDFLLHDVLTKWEEISDELRLDTLETAYAILYFQSNALYNDNLKLFVQKLIESIAQLNKNRDQIEAISKLHLHGLQNILFRLRFLISSHKAKSTDIQKDDNLATQIPIKELRRRTSVNSSVEQKESKQPTK